VGYRITVVSDKGSWMNDFLAPWTRKLQDGGHRVCWSHHAQEIKPGDFAFLLSCGQIVGKPLLQRSSHNLVVHASDLPRGRGWSPMTWKILSGETRIPLVLFEAAERVDSGAIYSRDTIELTGYELIDEWRAKLARKTLDLCDDFLLRYPGIVAAAEEQRGEPSYYPRRTAADSRLDPNRPLREQFNLLRVADNERYPCYFELGGETYVLKIEKKGIG
jgi:methionyl-tRNA formyltransferase